MKTTSIFIEHSQLPRKYIFIWYAHLIAGFTVIWSKMVDVIELNPIKSLKIRNITYEMGQ